MASREVEQGEFGAAFETARAKKGMSLRDTAEALEISYEHTRRLQKSLTLPSRLLLPQICKVLGMDYRASVALVINDRMRQKYSAAMPTIPGQHPKTAYIDRQLMKLSPQQVNAAIAMIDGLVRASKAGR